MDIRSLLNKLDTLSSILNEADTPPLTLQRVSQIEEAGKAKATGWLGRGNAQNYGNRELAWEAGDKGLPGLFNSQGEFVLPQLRSNNGFPKIAPPNMEDAKILADKGLIPSNAKGPAGLTDLLSKINNQTGVSAKQEFDKIRAGQKTPEPEAGNKNYASSYDEKAASNYLNPPEEKTAETPAATTSDGETAATDSATKHSITPQQIARFNELINKINKSKGSTTAGTNTTDTAGQSNFPLNQIAKLQSELKKAGMNIGTFGINKDGIDGKFGRVTARALLDVEKKQGGDQIHKTYSDLVKRAKEMLGVKDATTTTPTTSKPVATKPVATIPIAATPTPAPNGAPVSGGPSASRDTGRLAATIHRAISGPGTNSEKLSSAIAEIKNKYTFDQVNAQYKSTFRSDMLKDIANDLSESDPTDIATAKAILRLLRDPGTNNAQGNQFIKDLGWERLKVSAALLSDSIKTNIKNKLLESFKYVNK